MKNSNDTFILKSSVEQPRYENKLPDEDSGCLGCLETASLALQL